MNTMERRRGMMGGEDNAPWWTSGEVTLASNGAITLTHNLGTKNIGLWVWPIEDLTFSTTYLAWQFNVVNWQSMLPESLQLNFNSYNSHFTEPVIVNPRTSLYWRVVGLNISPIKTRNDWRNTSEPANYGTYPYEARARYTITDNSITFQNSLCKGKYRWVAIDLNRAYKNNAHNSGTITLTNAGAIDIVHNLNTTQVLVCAFPINDVVPTAGYQPYAFARINLDSLKPSAISMDFTAYSTALTTPQTLTPSTSVFDVSSMVTPWTTSGNWWGGQNNPLAGSIAYTVNSTKLTTTCSKSIYQWYAIDISSITLGGGV